jgi:hypothetical protein
MISKYEIQIRISGNFPVEFSGSKAEMQEAVESDLRENETLKEYKTKVTVKKLKS